MSLNKAVNCFTFTLANFCVFLRVYLHTKRAIDSTLSVTSNAKRNKRTSVLNFSKTKQVCSSLFCQLIYVHIRVLKHTKRVVQACCERAITVSIKVLWRVTYSIYKECMFVLEASKLSKTRHNFSQFLPWSILA